MPPCTSADYKANFRWSFGQRGNSVGAAVPGRETKTRGRKRKKEHLRKWAWLGIGADEAVNRTLQYGFSVVEGKNTVKKAWLFVLCAPATGKRPPAFSSAWTTTVFEVARTETHRRRSPRRRKDEAEILIWHPIDDYVIVVVTAIDASVSIGRGQLEAQAVEEHRHTILPLPLRLPRNHWTDAFLNELLAHSCRVR